MYMYVYLGFGPLKTRILVHLKTLEKHQDLKYCTWFYDSRHAKIRFLDIDTRIKSH